MDAIGAYGLRIAYARVGDGPPLVFVHGAAEDGRVWRPQLEALADELTVLAWDEPGAGRSSDLPEDFELADFADRLAANHRDSRARTSHYPGQSRGGTVVLELYRRHPGLVANLIMIDTYAGWKGFLAGRGGASAARRRSADAPGVPAGFDPALPGLVRQRPAAVRSFRAEGLPSRSAVVCVNCAEHSVAHGGAG